MKFGKVYRINEKRLAELRKIVNEGLTDLLRPPREPSTKRTDHSRHESFTERKFHEMKVSKHPNTNTEEKQQPSQEGE